jgi:hypothetical protein
MPRSQELNRSVAVYEPHQLDEKRKLRMIQRQRDEAAFPEAGEDLTDAVSPALGRVEPSDVLFTKKYVLSHGLVGYAFKWRESDDFAVLNSTEWHHASIRQKWMIGGADEFASGLRGHLKDMTGRLFVTEKSRDGCRSDSPNLVRANDTICLPGPLERFDWPMVPVFMYDLGIAAQAVHVEADRTRTNDAVIGIKRRDTPDGKSISPMDVRHGQSSTDDAG